jgi:AraC-like DNA-binding protein
MQGAPVIQLTSSSSFPRGSRFAYWADVVAQTFVPLQCDTPDRARFAGELRHRQIGLIVVSEVRASAMLARRTKAKIAAGPRDDAIVVLQLAGSCNAGQQAQAARLQPGGGAIVTADEPYFFEFPNAFRQLVIKLPRCLMADDRIGAGRGHALLLSGVGARLLRKLALSSLEDPFPLVPDEEAGVERAFADLLSAAVPASDGRRAVANASPRYVAACQFIRRQLTNPALTPAAVASYVNMSTRNLARIFARQGTTIDRTIWSERLIAARRDLVDPRFQESSITEVAFSWGFNDAAHFSRRFASAYGISPAAYRAGSLVTRATSRR